MDENALTQDVLLADIRQALREEERELKAEEKALEKLLVRIELPLIFGAAIAIVVMSLLNLGAICEICPLLPSSVLAIVRIVK